MCRRITLPCRVCGSLLTVWCQSSVRNVTCPTCGQECPLEADAPALLEVGSTPGESRCTFSAPAIPTRTKLTTTRIS